ncbi:MAG: NUDIX hydrolase [Bacteroidota bacterium]
MTDRLTSDALRTLLSGPLPGEAAQLRMAPRFRGEFPNNGKAPEAAVVFVIYRENGLLHTVFIRRNVYPGPHSAQVSLPGGMKEAGDCSLEETAIRELREETGIAGVALSVLGALTPLHIPVSNILVYPFVAWAEGQPAFNPDPEEVQYLIRPSLEDLFAASAIEEEMLERHGTRFPVPYFRCGRDKIWGATAMMISELKELICSGLPGRG